MSKTQTLKLKMHIPKWLIWLNYPTILLGLKPIFPTWCFKCEVIKDEQDS